MPPLPGWRHAFAGVSMAVTIALGFFAGYYADHRWGSGPWGVLLGTLLGAAAGFYNLYKEFKDDSTL